LWDLNIHRRTSKEARDFQSREELEGRLYNIPLYPVLNGTKVKLLAVDKGQKMG